MSSIWDRGPGNTGSRPFITIKHFIFVFLLLVVGFAYYATRMVLVIIPEDNKQQYAFPTKAGDTWYISLTHSVELTLWEEFFRVNDVNNMTMTHTTFESLGWGFPYAPEEGKLTHRPDGRYELVMNRPFNYVPLRISVQAMQHFHHGSTDLDLCKIYGQGTKMDIKAMYRYNYWLQKF